MANSIRTLYIFFRIWYTLINEGLNVGRTIITDDGRFELYKSSEGSKHPHTQKLKVECSLDEDIIQWLEGKTGEDEEYPMYINYFLRKTMDKERA
jgi:hypothetical protein